MVEMQKALRQAFHRMSIFRKTLIILLTFLSFVSECPAATLKGRAKKKTTTREDPQPRFKINPSRKPMTPPSVSAEAAEDPILKAMPAFTDMDLPTDNQMLFSRMNEKDFFQPTFSNRTISAMFGYVRNPGPGGRYTRFHEGVDIRPAERDEGGEPSDVVKAAAAGTVAYVCRKPSGSNYGNYVVVAHDLFGPPFYTLYAHLASVADDIETGTVVERGRTLGILGRTSNEFDIDQDRAHLHFEVDLMVNPRYIEWSKKKGDGVPKHGLYNGANLIGVDPVRFFQFMQYNPDLGIGEFVQRERVAFRLLVPAKKPLPWIKRHPFALTAPVTDETVAYEISMTNYGLPVRVIPRTKSEIASGARKAMANGLYPLTYANGAELRNACVCQLLYNRGSRWGLSTKGKEWIQQLMF